MPSVLLWACLAENLFLFAAQKNLRIFLSCFFTGRGRGGKRHLLLSACGRRAATSDWRNPKKQLRDLHALERRSHPADHGPSFASLFPPLAAVSSAAIPVRVKLKTPRANAAAATTLDIPSRWDLQQRRPRPVADAGRSCWGSGQQDARAAQGTRGCWEPQPEALSNSPLG